jgi:hypothetical protein
MTNHSIKLTLPPELASQLAALRSARGTTIQVLIRQLLWQALSDRKPGRPAEHPLAAKGKAVYWDLQEHFKKLKAEFASHPRQTLVDFEKLYGPQISQELFATKTCIRDGLNRLTKGKSNGSD